MMNTTLNQRLGGVKPLTRLALNLGLFAGLAAAPLCADETKVPPGYTEDEWYDPGDWLDGNNIEPIGNDYWDTDWHDTYDRAQSSVWPHHYHYYWDPIQVGWIKWSKDGSQNTADSSNTGNSRQPVVFDGKVDGFKKVNLQGGKEGDDDATFVRIRLKNGEARVVNLGSRVDLKSLNLQKGDEIRVSGHNEKIDERKVLAARQVTVDGKNFRITPDRGEQVSIQGTVKNFTKTSIGGARDKNLLVRLELENGKSCVVDLGKGISLGDLELENGAQIRLKGEKTQVKGKSLIVARQISVDDDTTRLRKEKSGPRDAGDRSNREEPDMDSTEDRAGDSSDTVTAN